MPVVTVGMAASVDLEVLEVSSGTAPTRTKRVSADVLQRILFSAAIIRKR